MGPATLKSIESKSCELKAARSPVYGLTPREKKYLQNLVDDMYIQFVEVVAEVRKLDSTRLNIFLRRARLCRGGYRKQSDGQCQGL
jgi:ClpP class serine protease